MKDVLWFFLNTVLLISAVHSEGCISFSNYKNHLGTKTPYRLIANTDDHTIEMKDCVPLKIWSVIRHGTRYPSVGFINKTNNRLIYIKNEIIKNKDNVNKSAKCVKAFEDWYPNVEKHQAKNLAVEGEDEMILLAERMQNRFPELLSNIYSNTSYFLKYTNTQRTKKSAESFVKGLFGKGTSKDVWFPQGLNKDPVLRFYKLCSKWRTDVKKNSKSSIEKEIFKKSQAEKLVLKLKNTLGFNLNLTIDDIHDIYMTCSFETAWFKRKESVWCSLLDEDTFKTLEYYEDLKYYWIDGYGYKINYDQACVAFRDLIDFFKSSDPYPKAKIYFTHSGTLLKMLAHLGLHKDESPLTNSNFSAHSERKWRVSKIDAFGTNLALVLYKCGEEYKVLTLHQENVVHIRGCPQTELCELSTLEANFHSSINCDFEKMCTKI